MVYSDAPTDYLSEYAQKYACVEIDQWFWSLFGPDKVVLPQSKVVAQYAAAVPEGFRFGIKLPNAITLTHLHQTDKTAPLVPNPHFLSVALLRSFLDLLAPLREKLGPMMLQFGYLNKQMVPSQDAFMEQLDAFVRQLPTGYTWCVESRNPNYLNAPYFAFLREHGLAHVFEQGYYMPPVRDVYQRFADQLSDQVVIRLHGPDWQGIEKKTNKDWSKICAPHDTDMDALASVLKDLKARKRQAWAFVNNHFEGCAPATIRRLEERIAQGGTETPCAMVEADVRREVDACLRKV
ncbi:MAG: DUF72 domain-containing protein [Pseudomonadota bacterium]